MRTSGTVQGAVYQFPAKAVGDPVAAAALGARRAMLELQNPEGYWRAELESNVTITAEYILLLTILGEAEPGRVARMVNYLRSKQLDNGGWSLWYGDGGELSTTVEAYQALKLAGVPPSDPALQKARTFIQGRGGVLKSRVFTRIFLALFGQVSWDGIPTLPVEFNLMPLWSGLSIYELSSWSRATIVPLSVVMVRRPVFAVPPELGVAELFGPDEHPSDDHRVRFQLNGLSLDNFFVLADVILKQYHRLAYPPVRKRALKKAEAWILAHQEESGDWGGIQPAMLNSLLALHCLGYPNDHPVIRRGLAALEAFTLAEGDRLWLQSCISPVWDTALAVRALVAAGLEPGHPALTRACHWLLAQQIFQPGDWSLKNPYLPAGGWAFEFVNNHYPDVDDSAVVLMALKEGLERPEAHRTALRRGLDWCVGMQSKNGGFAAFDVDNTKEWLNHIPFADLKALIDPPTEDVTARVLEMLGAFGYNREHPAAQRALEYLQAAQQPDGSWWGRWGVNYIYGTWSVLMGLERLGEDMRQSYVRQAVGWLKAHQNPDGGWGETCSYYHQPKRRGQGDSTASQTAWALMGLMTAGETDCPEVARGVDFLVRTQRPDGRWDEEFFTGTGFPGYFMIRYHLYRDCFPLMALGMYLRRRGAKEA